MNAPGVRPGSRSAKKADSEAPATASRSRGHHTVHHVPTAVMTGKPGMSTPVKAPPEEEMEEEVDAEVEEEGYESANKEIASSPEVKKRNSAYNTQGGRVARAAVSDMGMAAVEEAPSEMSYGGLRAKAFDWSQLAQLMAILLAIGDKLPQALALIAQLWDLFKDSFPTLPAPTDGGLRAALGGADLATLALATALERRIAQMPKASGARAFSFAQILAMLKGLASSPIGGILIQLLTQFLGKK